MSCIFCRIVAGEVPSDILYQDEKVVAIRDISPQAPTHILILPKRHVAYVSDLTGETLPLMSHMVKVANEMARKEDIADRGYRLVVNCGPEGGQVVSHLHLHLLGGRQLKGEMG